MSVTINQVAEAAGVSTSTVSRVFTAPEQVGAKSRDRVLHVARELGYMPNRTARSLVKGTTGTLGIIVPNIENPFFPPVLKTVIRHATRKDYAVLVGDTDGSPSEQAELATHMTKQVDGLILWASGLSSGELLGISERIPTVLVNRRVEGIPSVLVPSTDGMRQAVEHLHALGHRICCFLNGPQTSQPSSRRRAAVRAACRTFEMELLELGPYGSSMQGASYEASFQSGVHAADLVLASEATAVIAHSDVAALGVLRQLAARHVDVPGQISVVGVDDIGFATFSSPSLTTVRVPVREVATAAVDVVLDRLRSPEQAEAPVVEFSTQLIVRNSTGGAPTGR